MDTIDFVLLPTKPDDRRGGVRMVINGRDLADAVRGVEATHAAREGHPNIAGAYSGLPAGPDICPPSGHFLGKPSSPLYSYGSKVAVFDCECGCPGCWPLVCQIEVTADTVVWRDFEQVHRRPGHPSGAWSYDGLGPFVFSRAQYEQALARLGAA